MSDSLLDRIRGEFREMPGLQLTVAQACRLWQIDLSTCEAVLYQLIREDFLRESSSGTFIALPSRGKPAKAALDESVVVRRRA